MSDRRDDPRPISETLDRILRSLGNPGIAAVRTVFSEWETIVGADTAAHAKPVSLDGQCLLVVGPWKFVPVRALGRRSVSLAAGRL